MATHTLHRPDAKQTLGLAHVQFWLAAVVVLHMPTPAAVAAQAGGACKGRKH